MAVVVAAPMPHGHLLCRGGCSPNSSPRVGALSPRLSVQSPRVQLRRGSSPSPPLRSASLQPPISASPSSRSMRGGSLNVSVNASFRGLISSQPSKKVEAACRSQEQISVVTQCRTSRLDVSGNDLSSSREQQSLQAPRVDSRYTPEPSRSREASVAPKPSSFREGSLVVKRMSSREPSLVAKRVSSREPSLVAKRVSSRDQPSAATQRVQTHRDSAVLTTSPAMQKRACRGSAAPPLIPKLPKSDVETPLTQKEMATQPVIFRSSRAQGSVLPRRILCYGDSLTAGFHANGQKFEPYGRELSKALAAAGVENEVHTCGLSGHTTQDMVAQLDSAAATDIVKSAGKGLRRILEETGPFDLCIIMSGTNDLALERPRNSIVEDILQLHAVCHARSVPTILIAPPPAPRNTAPREAVKRSMVDNLREWARNMPKVATFVDPASIFPSKKGSPLWESDGLHFSAAGSRELGSNLALLIAELFLNTRAAAAA